MMAPVAIAGLFIFLVACGVGFGAASADSTDELARAGAFGFDAATHEATQDHAAESTEDSSGDDVSSKSSVLAEVSARDIAVGLQMIDELEEAERPQVEADNKAVIQRVETEKAKQGFGPKATSADEREHVTDKTPVEGIPESKLDEYRLPAVDWSVGKYEFLAEWSERIDAYLEGTPLQGYGTTFAAAAWRNGIDPRWSPAVSNTESGNGKHCFLPHNAWGWGDDEWPDWETAINEHVDGLALGYGYSLTVEAAQKYCPPNSVHWYNNTLGQMALI